MAGVQKGKDIHTCTYTHLQSPSLRFCCLSGRVISIVTSGECKPRLGQSKNLGEFRSPSCACLCIFIPPRVLASTVLQIVAVPYIYLAGVFQMKPHATPRGGEAWPRYLARLYISELRTVEMCLMLSKLQ